MPSLDGYGVVVVAIAAAIVVVVLGLVGRRMSGGTSIVDQLPPDRGPDLKAGETGRKPDIGAEDSESQGPPSGA